MAMPNPAYAPFAMALMEAMRAKDMNSSMLARLVWGTIKDKRGYDVARNRDRIGHYLKGTSRPNGENLQKIADILGVLAEDLMAPPLRLGRPPQGMNGEDVQLATVPGQPGKMKLQAILNRHLAVAVLGMIVELTKQEPRKEMPHA